MKNLLQLLFFSLLSAFLLALMIVLAFLPRICSCCKRICYKQHETLKLQRQRARQIKQARLKIAYQTQIMHEKPCNEDLEICQGIFFDEDSQQKQLDKESLVLYQHEQHRHGAAHSQHSRRKHGLFALKKKLYELFELIKLNLQSLLDKKRFEP